MRRIAFPPRCFRWKFEIESGPVAGEFLRVLIVSDIMLVVKGGGGL